MIKGISQRQTYNYAYDEYDLPARLHDRFDLIGSSYAKLYAITYKQIGLLEIEDKKALKIRIYPNALSNLVHNECDITGTLLFYDVSGLEVLNQSFNTKIAVSIAHLRNRVYSIKLMSNASSVFTNRKIVKEETLISYHNCAFCPAAGYSKQIKSSH